MSEISQENLFLIEEIVRTEEWTTIPPKSKLLEVLHNLQANTEDKFKYLIDNLLQHIEVVSYAAIEKIIKIIIES